METTFTPLDSLVGGVLIGLVAVSLMLLRGRSMGATDLLAGEMWPATAAFMLTTGPTVDVIRHMPGR